MACCKIGLSIIEPWGTVKGLSGDFEISKKIPPLIEESGGHPFQQPLCPPNPDSFALSLKAWSVSVICYNFAQLCSGCRDLPLLQAKLSQLDAGPRVTVFLQHGAPCLNCLLHISQSGLRFGQRHHR